LSIERLNGEAAYSSYPEWNNLCFKIHSLVVISAMENKQIKMNIVNPHAAGIDIGSRTHYVAIGQSTEDVRTFGIYTEDHQKMITWLQDHKITTIAMESTGSYWQTLFAALQSIGFEVLLVNGKQIKNVKGKTDVKDCIWIQKLHSLGLLTGSFLPSADTSNLRTLYRHRVSMVEESTKMINKMQKSLRLMNLRLDVVLNDIMGTSGRSIVEAILSGVRDGVQLASLAHYTVRTSKDELAKSLQGQWNDELLYELKDCYECYCFFETKLSQCDKKIEALINSFTAAAPAAEESKLIQKKNDPPSIK
jgi:transposase